MEPIFLPVPLPGYLGHYFGRTENPGPRTAMFFFCLAPCQAIRALRATRAPPEGSWGGGFTAFCGFLKHPHQGGASHTASALTQSVSEVLEAMKLALRLLVPTPSLECQFLEISICVSSGLFRTSPVIFVVSVLCSESKFINDSHFEPRSPTSKTHEIYLAFLRISSKMLYFAHFFPPRFFHGPKNGFPPALV